MKIRFWLVGAGMALIVHAAGLWWLSSVSTTSPRPGDVGEMTIDLVSRPESASGIDIPESQPDSVVDVEPEQAPEQPPEQAREGADRVTQDSQPGTAVAEELQSQPGADDYLHRLEGWIQRFHAYPPRALRRGLEGTVLVEFTVDAEGLVLEQRILRSSGSPMLDRAAIDTLDAASPMPMPPEDQVERVFRVPLAFRPAP